MPLLHDMKFLCLCFFSVFLRLRGSFFLCQLPLYKLVYVTWRFPRNKDFWWSFSFFDMLTAGIATSWALANKWFLESFFLWGQTQKVRYSTYSITIIVSHVLRWLWQVNWWGPGFEIKTDWAVLSGVSCRVYVYVRMPSTWPGVQGTRAPSTRTRGLSTGSAAGPKGAHSPMT